MGGQNCGPDGLLCAYADEEMPITTNAALIATNRKRLNIRDLGLCTPPYSTFDRRIARPGREILKGESAPKRYNKTELVLSGLTKFCSD